MLARLLLALLLAAFALPASAPCHDAAPRAMAGMAMPHEAPATPDREHKAVLAHTCIGCVPPSNWRGAVVAIRLVPAMPPTPVRPARLDLARAVPPATPPPRTPV